MICEAMSLGLAANLSRFSSCWATRPCRLRNVTLGASKTSEPRERSVYARNADGVICKIEAVQQIKCPEGGREHGDRNPQTRIFTRRCAS
jgi:hypothetical protein